MNNSADIDKVYDEILWLLIAGYVYQHLKDGNIVKMLKDMDRYDVGDYLFSARAIFDTIVIRVCRLDDDTSGVWSFYEARKRIFNEIRNERRKKSITTEMSRFRQLINPIKTRIRNNGIAHALVSERETLKSFDLHPILKLICNIGDLLADRRMEYTYSCGRYEKVNLREYYNI